MSEQKTIEFKKTRDFGQKFNVTFEFLRQEFKPLLNAILFISGPPIVLGSIMGAYYQKNSLSLMDFASFSEGVLQDDFLISAIVMLIFSYVAYIFIFATINEYILEYSRSGTNVRTQDVWTQVKANLTRYIGSALGLSVFTIALLVIVSLFAAAIIAANVLFLNFLLFIAFLLGIFFMFVFIYIAYIVINCEEVGLLSAINRTVTLLRGNWFATIGLFIVGSLMVSLLNIVFTLPNAILTSLGLLHSIENPDAMQLSLSRELLHGFTAFIASAGGFFMTVIIMLLMIFQYYHLAEKLDASGLLDRIGSLGETRNDDDEEHY